ncbi:MAG: FAD-dependent oxidoreductase [Verrucomicrobia bacterium]|nr:FAD-dependent oxidoreductase [Verrucomicrobiota bacterium]
MKLLRTVLLRRQSRNGRGEPPARPHHAPLTDEPAARPYHAPISVQILEGRAPSRPFAQGGHDGAWPSIFLRAILIVALTSSVLAGEYDCDVAVIGGGSGGFGAALAAARLGLDVVLVEKGDCLGGTSTRGGVNCWEMGAGGTGIPFDLYKELKKIPKAIAIYTPGRHMSTFDPKREMLRFPGGENVIDPSRRYYDTLWRHIPRGQTNTAAYRRERWHGLPFEPEAMAKTMRAMLDATGHCRVLLNTAFVSADAGEGRVRSVQLSNGNKLRARYFIDGTGDGLLCVAAGCQVMTGQEPRDRFNEPTAPTNATARVNGVTLIYRVTPVKEHRAEGAAVPCWWRKSFPVACVNHYPNGDLSLNMLPTMEGEEFMRLGYDAALAECQKRVRAHWHHFQNYAEEFRRFRLTWVAPALGVRETRRIVGEYVLTENDLYAGLSGQKHSDIVCLADHMMDTHGGHSKHRGELTEPYGVPYRCLVPKGFRNLLVASRASSFSSLAASSCRLSRTMMQLGQAAGTAAALAKELNVDLTAVPADRLRDALRRQNVQLEHPMPAALRSHLEKE